MKLRTLQLLTFSCSLWLFAQSAEALPDAGRISGVVVDSSGTPQMGATVFVASEQLFNSASLQVRTNDRGRFSTVALSPGIYSIKVTLAGFLPAIDQHIEVGNEGETLLQVVLGSVFSSLEELRKKPGQRVGSDDWAWVLRSSARNRSVLQWQDPAGAGQPDPLDSVNDRQSHGQFEFTSGADHPGSIANLADSPSTAFAYDMGVGGQAQLLMAGQFSYEASAPSASVASEWLPSGKAGIGPVTTLVIRESHLGPDGPIFRGLRLSHDDQIVLSNRLSLRYGGEYILAEFGGSTSALRPRVGIEMLLAPGWSISGTIAERPWEDEPSSENPLQSTLDTLDTFPTLMVRHDRPVLENNLHEELSVNRSFGSASLTAAVFHDGARHTAVVGRGAGAFLSSDFVQDYFSQAFSYDGGNSESMGTRLAYQQKITGDVKTVFVYAYDGALAPTGDLPGHVLRSQLATRDRQSLAGRISTAVPGTGTKLSVGYKWISGPTVSQQDIYGESLYDMSPYLNVQLRQSLPGTFAGHMALQADFGNLLAQGYVPMTGPHSKQFILVPAYRYLRGGLSFQF